MIFVNLIECVAADLEQGLQGLVDSERGHCEIISVLPTLINNGSITSWAVVWKDTREANWQGGAR